MPKTIREYADNFALWVAVWAIVVLVFWRYVFWFYFLPGILILYAIKRIIFSRNPSKWGGYHGRIEEFKMPEVEFRYE